MHLAAEVAAAQARMADAAARPEPVDPPTPDVPAMVAAGGEAEPAPVGGGGTLFEQPPVPAADAAPVVASADPAVTGVGPGQSRATARPPAAPVRRPRASAGVGGRFVAWLRRVNWLRVAKRALVAYVVWLLFVAVHFAFSMHKVAAAAPAPVAGTPGSVWLMVGSDSREGLTAKERSSLTTGGEVGQRTDTIMLLHYDMFGSPKLVSIPRDSWVTIPQHTNSAGGVVAAHSAKINAAFSEGGAPLLAQTIENATGLHVDHYAQVGFTGIVDLTNSVGGIRVCFDQAIDDVKSGLKVSKGCHNLNGKKALAYVRMRYSDPKGDLGRIERQQTYVSKVMHKVLSLPTLLNPFRLWAVSDAALDSLSVDQQASVFSLGRLGLALGQVASGGAEVTTVPTDDSDHWENGQWVLHWHPEQAPALWRSLGAPAN